MVAQFIIIFLFILSVLAILVLYAIKLAYHFLYLRLKDKKRVGELGDFFLRNFINKGDNERWKNAFMLFPLLYSIALDEPTTALNEMKQRIKKINVFIYVVLIVALLVVVYASKAFPEGIV